MSGVPVLPDPDLVAKEAEGEQAVFLGRRAEVLEQKVDEELTAVAPRRRVQQIGVLLLQCQISRNSRWWELRLRCSRAAGLTGGARTSGR